MSKVVWMSYPITKQPPGFWLRVQKSKPADRYRKELKSAVEGPAKDMAVNQQYNHKNGYIHHFFDFSLRFESKIEKIWKVFSLLPSPIVSIRIKE